MATKLINEGLALLGIEQHRGADHSDNSGDIDKKLKDRFGHLFNSVNHKVVLVDGMGRHYVAKGMNDVRAIWHQVPITEALTVRYDTFEKLKDKVRFTEIRVPA